MRKINICAEVYGETIQEFLKNIDQAQELSDFIELRVDCIKDLKKSDLPVILKRIKAHNIFTFRHTRDSGKYNGDEKLRVEFLQLANDLGFEYVDIDYSVMNEIKIENLSAKRIISYHNSHNTPGIEELSSILEKMRKRGGEIYKFAVMANTFEDVSNLIKLILMKKENEEMIVMGMGEKASFTRVLTPMLGGFLTFASLDEKVTLGPGQIPVKELKSIFNKLDAYWPY
jgi:3-dehydroquinate dehydratase type I